MKQHHGHRIVVAPIGSIQPSWLDAIEDAVTRIFDFSISVQPMLEDISFAFDPERGQYNSTTILNRLAVLLPETAVRILAITDVDLFIPILTYVYGEAQLGGVAAILSVHRLTQDPLRPDSDRIVLTRIAKEAIHEIGHTFHLKHCPDHTCIMHYCRGIRDVDNKNDQLCRYCRIFLSDALKQMATRFPHSSVHHRG